jgi:hypothetical protein
MFFIAALMCHTLLNGSRPSSSHLTEFYLWISVGGVIGGLFNSILAPIIFKTVAEYPIAIVAACLLRPRPANTEKRIGDWLHPVLIAVVTGLIVLFVQTGLYSSMLGHLADKAHNPIRIGLIFGVPAILCFLAVDRPIRFGLSLSVFLFIATVSRVNSEGHIVFLDRSFFGVHRVEVSDVEIEGNVYLKAVHRYSHGNTVHGMQLTIPKYRHLPLTYYYPNGPIGQVMTKLNEEGALQDLALVGLGTGALAAYGQPGQNMVFYEIDPQVVHLARDSGFFTYVTDSKAQVSYVVGDARLSLVDARNHSYDIIVLDAFSSDSIPVHLMTKQALELYALKLRKGGLIAFHISNRYLNLEPIVANLAESTGMACLSQEDYLISNKEKAEGKYQSTWVILAPDASAMTRFKKDPRWTLNPPNNAYPLWTDDYSNILRVFEL